MPALIFFPNVARIFKIPPLGTLPTIFWLRNCGFYASTSKNLSPLEKYHFIVLLVWQYISLSHIKPAQSPLCAMMKPCHAITKCEPTPPRPFSRAFHPIYLIAAEVTRLKSPLTARFDHLPAFVPTGINLIRPNPAKSGQKTFLRGGDSLSPQPPPPVSKPATSNANGRIKQK